MLQAPAQMPVVRGDLWRMFGISNAQHSTLDLIGRSSFRCAIVNLCCILSKICGWHCFKSAIALQQQQLMYARGLLFAADRFFSFQEQAQEKTLVETVAASRAVRNSQR